MTRQSTKPKVCYRFTVKSPSELASETSPHYIMYRRSSMGLAAQKAWFTKRWANAANDLISVEVSKAHETLAELRQPKNQRAYQRLRDKAAWEGVTLLTVLEEWGDPRAWGE